MSPDASLPAPAHHPDERHADRGPDARRPSPGNGTAVVAAAVNATLPMAREEARATAERVVGSLGLKGVWGQLANFTAVLIGAGVAVTLVFFLIDEVRQARRDADAREERYLRREDANRSAAQEQIHSQRQTDAARTDAIVSAVGSLTSEVRAGQSETRAARQAFERVEKLLEKIVGKMPDAPPGGCPQTAVAPEPRRKT